jgi:hypothetical protein
VIVLLAGVTPLLVVRGLRFALGTRLLLMRHLGGPDLRLALALLMRLDLLMGLALLVRLNLLVGLDLLMGLEMLPGTIIPRGRRAHGSAMARLRLLVFNLCSLPTPKLRCAAIAAIITGRLMIVEPGTGMGEVGRACCGQNLRPTAILRSMQLTHALRLLPVTCLLGGQPGVMLTHDHAVVLTGLRAHAALPAIEAHVRTAPMRRRRVVDVDNVHAPEIRH